MEEEVLDYLAQSPGIPYSAKQVGKALDKRRYREEPDWARPILEWFVLRRIVVCDCSGYYFQVERR